MFWIGCMKWAARVACIAFVARLSTIFWHDPSLATNDSKHGVKISSEREPLRAAIPPKGQTASQSCSPKAFERSALVGSSSPYDRSAAAYIRDLSTLATRWCLIPLRLSSMRCLFHCLVAGMSTGHFLFPYFLK
uniref:Secreted protein n=1 Tax=Ixodes ricinus TaxID=34613 RepID=A0A147BE90_IXORI